MLDENYYKELVIHPPPLNFFSMFIIPFSFSRNSMKSVGKFFSKLMYWFENLHFLFIFIIRELILLPIIYLKILGNIMIQASFKTLAFLLPLWLIFGLLCVMIFVGIDVFTYIRILCDYSEDHSNKAKEEEDYK